MNYTDFVKQTFSHFQSLHNSFRADYKLDDYDHWFYNQSTEVLRLYNSDSDEIFFKYIPIGSYSTKTQTWMWIWLNEHSIEPSKFDTLAIKKFGEQENYKKLSEGYFESDEYDGWEFIAIAQHLLGGIGGYRAQSDHLLVYFLIQREISRQEVERLEASLIQCRNHGKARPAFICQHLNLREKAGFEEAFPTYRAMPLAEDEDFQAWCDECEKMRIKHAGWNDESMRFANTKVVCEGCYFEIKDFNFKKTESDI